MSEEEIQRSEAVIKLEQDLLKTTWVKEAELIKKFVPEEDLSKNQVKLLDKCIDKEDFTDKQFKDLKVLLNKYRLLLRELKPEETLESVEEAVQLIKSEQDFLNLMDEQEEKYLTVHLPTPKGNLLEFEFEVLPITDSRVIESLELQIDLFRDFTLEETATYASASQKKPQDRTPEEESILVKMNSMLSDKLGSQRIRSVDNFLANQLILKGSESDLNTRLLFWQKFPFNAKFMVFVAVQRRLGLTDVDNEKLFPFGE